MKTSSRSGGLGTAEQERRAAAEAFSAGATEPAELEAVEPDDLGDDGPAERPGRTRSAPPRLPREAVKAGNVGGGFVLGLLAWAVGLTYLREGRDGVKKLLRAKFLNQVDQ